MGKAKEQSDCAASLLKKLEVTKENKTNETTVVSLQKAVKLVEEMNESKEKRLQALGQ